jgi:DNA-binding NarL/FixJ family response regulator
MSTRIVHFVIDESSKCGAAQQEKRVPVPGEPVRILIVDDFEPWRNAVSAILQNHTELQFVGGASDGKEAVQKAKELKPDLIVLDIGLPHMSGIEAARQIRAFAPDVAILFLTMNNHALMVREALNSGAKGYVLKTDAGTELWPAIKAVLQNEQFVSSGLHLAKTATADRERG